MTRKSTAARPTQVKHSIDLDDADLTILRELQRDARASFKSIAQKAGVSEATVFVRVRKMQERGVIRGFAALIPATAVGKPLTAIVLVRAQPRTYTGILDALKKFDDIYEIYDVTGQYYSILKIRTSGTEELGKIIDQVGKIDGIAGTETVIVLRTVKEETAIQI
ncbi:MAG TPA: Lrp/AsnC family transcriptional regulator [Terriglobales bacterium]|nr:Lrp/AsnC family transcriptional regulator [Terriglobales bacterium]